MAEESRIAPVTTSGRNVEGFYGNPPPEVGIHGSIPVYQSPTGTDAGYLGLGFGNLSPSVAGWCSRIPISGVNPMTGYYHDFNSGLKIGSNGSDQTGKEIGDDSVSGKKIKFLCSFGGKIFPRPRDGMLRYVGGHTRIISVKRNVSFSEFVQKMTEIYGQIVIIKYQLPDEDLDALVSISCPDDLENMMDECEKLIQRSSDGSAKLRIFLFSASEIDSSVLFQFGELQDTGQRYVEAINGIMDGGGCITRKESITSVASTQNSDLCGSEHVDGSGHGQGQGDVVGPSSTGMLSLGADLAPSQEVELVSTDPKPGNYAEFSAASLGISGVKCGPQILPVNPEPELEVSTPVTSQHQQMVYNLPQPGVTFVQPTPYLQAYVDPRQEALHRADYVQLPSQTGFPSQLLGSVGPAFTQQPFHDNSSGVSTRQFIPTMQTTITSSSHASMNPNMIPSLVQSQHIGSGFLQFPSDQNYMAYQAQVRPAVVGGGYGWHQVSPAEQFVTSDGRVPYQQVMLPGKIPRFEDCQMCQKALPHAHSDSLAQEKKDNPASTVPDLNSIYHSLRLEDKTRIQPMNASVVTEVLGKGVGGQQGIGAHLRVSNHEAGRPQFEAAGVSQNIEGHYDNQRARFHKIDYSGEPEKTGPRGVVGLAGCVQSPYGEFMSSNPQLYQENAVHKPPVLTQTQLQKVVMDQPFDGDPVTTESLHFQTSDHVLNESPNDNAVLPSIAHIEDTLGSHTTSDCLRTIDGGIENIHVCSPAAFVNNEKANSPINHIKEDNMESRMQQIAGRVEAHLDNAFNNPKVVLDVKHFKPNEMLPCSSNEVPYLHNNFRPLEFNEVAQLHGLDSRESYQNPKFGTDHLEPEGGYYGNTAFSSVESADTSERIRQLGELRFPSRFQPKIVQGDEEHVSLNGNVPSSLSPSKRIGDVQDSSNSLFSNQDPWNLQHDTRLPPKPNNFPAKKEVLGAADPFGENHLGNGGEYVKGNGGELKDGVYQPSGNVNTDFCSEYVRPNKDSGEELIKQELQAVAEGVAASVLQSSTSSYPDDMHIHMNNESSEANLCTEAQNSDVSLEHGANNQNVKTKMPENINIIGLPVSDSIGRLQIINNGDLEELQELGSGTFGTVYHGKWRGSDVAIKRINNRCFAGKPSEQDRMRDDFWNEAIKLAELHHPNVVAFYGVVLDGPGGSVATVTEYMVNGSLRNALQKNERNLDKRKRLLIAMDVAFGMEYLHGRNIVHFDLKSDNLLVNLRDPHRPICKVGDLGLSKVKCQTLISGGVRGTLPWMAPELLNGSSSLVSEKVDVFSFGIVMWELITGEEPYKDLHYGAIIGGIVSNTLRPPVPESCEPEWKRLMERCWASEPAERPSFTEIAGELRSIAAAKIPSKGPSGGGTTTGVQQK